MDLVIGTSAGVFLGDSEKGLAGQTVRQVIRLNGDLFAAGSDGVYRSADSGHSWTRSGVDAGEVWNLAASPHDPRLMYAGTQPAHLFVSHDGGDSWREVDSFLEAPDADRWCVPGSPPQGARVLALAFDPFDARRMWVGIEVGGVVMSDDNGAHWSAGMWLNGNADVHLLAAHRSKPDVLFATSGFGRNDDQPMDPRMAGPYRSDDGGKTWQFLAAGMGPHYTRAFCIDPRPPYPLTVPAVPDVRSSVKDPDGAQCLLYRSVDDGATWRSMGDAAHSPSRERMTAITSDPGEVGGVLVGTETGEVWRVTSSAEWTRVVDGLPAVQSILVL